MPTQTDTVNDPLNGCIDSEKLDKLVIELVKTSLYDASGKQKLKDAVVKVSSFFNVSDLPPILTNFF